MNFNELDAYWLLEGLACLWVTKSWETTLSCHSKNVLYPFSRNLDSPLPKFIYWGSFKFAGHVANANRCCCMSLQIAGVSFLKVFKSLIRMIDGLVVFI